MSNMVIVSGIIIVMVIIIYYLLRSSGTSLSSMQSGKTQTTVDSDKLPSSGGQNFTYSTWFFISDWNYEYGEQKTILKRQGNDAASGENVDCPHIYLGANENDINVDIGYKGSSSPPHTHTCQISNIPLQKWVNLIVSVYGRSVDLYIDGKLVRTCVMPGVANESAVISSPVEITPDGGFEGETAQFMYWDTATNPSEAATIYRKGYGGSLLGNLINKYRFQFTFIKDGRDVSSFQI